VSDGMGGLEDGHYAATITIEAISEWWEKQLPKLLEREQPTPEVFFNSLMKVLLSVNAILLHHAKERETSIGTTCSILLVCNDNYHIIHSGDSRIYKVQKKWWLWKKIVQLTDDHSWMADQLRKMVLSPKAIYEHPKRNWLISCLGVFESPKIFTTSGVLSQKGTFILCSDGLYRMVSDKELKLAVRNESCHGLVNELINTAKERGIKDNASVIAVCVYP
jgi:protein phosphatase